MMTTFSIPTQSRIVILGLLFTVGVEREVRAECVPSTNVSPASTVVTAEKKALAAGRYKAGNELLKKKDYEGALGLFLQSRALWHHFANTKNAAICLYELGRYPEALAFYEEMLHQFSKDLDAEERTLVAATVVELKKKVLIADVVESNGTFSIDDEACGSLPRRGPIYLMPGSHVLRVLRPGEPETLHQFYGNGGERIRVEIPKPAPPPSPPAPPGRWFVQAAIGPVIGWSGIGTLPVAQLEQSTGLVTQAYGGYWLSNGTIIALTTGLLQFDSFNSVFKIEKDFSAVDFVYDGNLRNPLFAPFVGITAGWGTGIGDRVDVWFRGGLGLLSAQSRNDVDVHLVPLLEIGGRQNEQIPVDVAGRRIVRSVPAYANLEIGGTVRVSRVHVGFVVGTMFLLTDGPALPDVYLLPRGRDSEFFDGACSRDMMTMSPNRGDADCVPGLRLARQSYRPAFMLLPQVVVGF